MIVKNRFNRNRIGEFDISPKANLIEANLPSPTMILLANWGNVSSHLCVELMRYDAANHPRPELFDEWTNGGDCPYNDIKWQRCANFKENRLLWSPGQSKSALELATMLLKEKCIWEEDLSTEG